MVATPESGQELGQSDRICLEYDRDSQSDRICLEYDRDSLLAHL